MVLPTDIKNLLQQFLWTDSFFDQTPSNLEAIQGLWKVLNISKKMDSIPASEKLKVALNAAEKHLSLVVADAALEYLFNAYMRIHGSQTLSFYLHQLIKTQKNFSKFLLHDFSFFSDKEKVVIAREWVRFLSKNAHKDIQVHQVKLDQELLDNIGSVADVNTRFPYEKDN